MGECLVYQDMAQDRAAEEGEGLWSCTGATPARMKTLKLSDARQRRTPLNIRHIAAGRRPGRATGVLAILPLNCLGAGRRASFAGRRDLTSLAASHHQPPLPTTRCARGHRQSGGGIRPAAQTAKRHGRARNAFMDFDAWTRPYLFGRGAGGPRHEPRRRATLERTWRASTCVACADERTLARRRREGAQSRRNCVLPATTTPEPTAYLCFDSLQTQHRRYWQQPDASYLPSTTDSVRLRWDAGLLTTLLPSI